MSCASQLLPPQPTPAGLEGLMHRRDLLRVGSLSVAATALPAALFGNKPAAAAARNEPREGQGKAKSVIFLWMAGGVTHIDSFDPKPNAPVEIRGVLEDMPTNVPGIRFCETLPHLAKIADKLAVLRSYSHDSNDHLISQVYTLSGKRIANMTQLYTEPNIGSLIWKLQGPRNGLPGYIAVPGVTRPGPPPFNLFVGGWLGNAYRPYCLGGIQDVDFAVGEKLYDPPAQATEDLKPQSLGLPDEVPLARLSSRRELRAAFDRALRTLDKNDKLLAAESQYENAMRLLTTPDVRRAFEVDDEPVSVREAYGRTKIGGRCLQARRLVESGARFVMVDYGYDPEYGNIWDNHNAPVQNHPPIQQMVRRGYHLAGMDQAFAALINDLDHRGLLETTLVCFITEFGRTPNINSLGGRDHWGAAGSLFFTGAGIQRGQVVGETDRTASKPITHPYGPWDVAATIYSLLGVNHKSFAYDLQDRPHMVLDEGEVITELL